MDAEMEFVTIQLKTVHLVQVIVEHALLATMVVVVTADVNLLLTKPLVLARKIVAHVVTMECADQIVVKISLLVLLNVPLLSILQFWTPPVIKNFREQVSPVTPLTDLLVQCSQTLVTSPFLQWNQVVSTVKSPDLVTKVTLSN